MTKTFLLTTGGGPGILAQLEALKTSRRGPVRVVMADANTASGNLFLPGVDAAYRIPLCLDRDFMPALLRLIEREDIDYLYSGLDEELPVLARNRARIEAKGCRMLLPSPDTLERVLDKVATMNCLGEAIHQPCTWLLGGELDSGAVYEETGGKLLFKISDSRGGRGIHIPEDRDEFDFLWPRLLARQAEQQCQYLVQKLVEGAEYNVSTLHDLSGRMIFAVCRRKFETRPVKSSTVAAVIERNQPVIDMAIQAVDMLGLARGFNNVEIIVGADDGMSYFIEANGGRTAAQDMNLVASGINLTDLAMAILDGEEVEPVPHPADGLAILKIRRDVVVPYSDIENVSVA